MAPKNKLLLYGFIIVALLETAAAIASREQIVDYSYLGLVLCVVYFTFGYLTTKQSDLNSGVINSIVLGTFDVIAGWTILPLVNVYYRQPANQQADILMYFFAGFAGILFATFFGSIGSGIAYYKFKRNRAMEEK